MAPPSLRSTRFPLFWMQSTEPFMCRVLTPPLPPRLFSISFFQRLAAAIQPNRAQLECIVHGDIPWGDAVLETTPGENAGQYCRTVVKRAGTRAGWVWRAYLRSPCCKALAFVCAGLSGVILWSEVCSLA